VLAQSGVGRASDRFGPRGVLAASMLLMGSGTLGVTVAPRLLALLAAALLLGLGFGGVLAAGNLLIARLFPTRGTTALNAVNLFFGVGAILGPAIVGLAGAYLWTPQIALWVGSGLLVALAPLIFRCAARLPAAHSLPAVAGSSSNRWAPWLLGLLLLVYVGTEVGFGGWLTLYMISSTNLDAGIAALVASGFWLALTTGRALGAGLGFRLVPTMVLMISLLGMLCGAALLALSVGGAAWSIAGVLLFGLSCGPVFPTVLALVAGGSGGSGVAASLVLALGNSGGLVVPALLGLLLTQSGAGAMAGLLLADSLTLVLLGTVIVRTSVVRRPA
jgi:fucose permease